MGEDPEWLIKFEMDVDVEDGVEEDEGAVVPGAGDC